MRATGATESQTAARALLAGLIDYAGLFPPAALGMAESVRTYADYLSSPSAWMLGRFVVAASRLDEFAMHGSRYWTVPAPWRVSVVGTIGDLAAVASFNNTHSGLAMVDSFEAKASTVAEIQDLAGRCAAWRGRAESVSVDEEASSTLRLYVEFPLSADLESLLPTVKAVGATAKVRTGGLTTDAFPTSRALARFLLLCTRHDVAFKATAGLHHALRGEYPLTYERGSARATMFGFMTVFLAALLAREGADAATLEALLEERDGTSIVADADGISWRGHRLTIDAVRGGRVRSAVSFGSCSFREPVEELGALGVAT